MTNGMYVEFFEIHDDERISVKTVTLDAFITTMTASMTGGFINLLEGDKEDEEAAE